MCNAPKSKRREVGFIREKRGRKNNSICNSECGRLLFNPKWTKQAIRKYVMKSTCITGMSRKVNRWPRIAKTAKYGKRKIFGSRV